MDCNTYVRRKNLRFGTNQNPLKSKTKCIVFENKNRTKPKNIILDGNKLPWAREVTHLGCTLEANNKMSKDMTVKRCIFNNRANSLIQEFHYCSPEVLMKCVNSYTTSFVGSQLWSIRSQGCDRIFKSWNVLVRTIFSLDRTTHRSLIEPISSERHIKNSLCSRFAKFADKITRSDKFIVRFLSNLIKDDLRTVFGNNLHYISQLCGVSYADLTQPIVRNKLKYWNHDESDDWRVGFAKELHGLLNDDGYLDGFSPDELCTIFRFICTQ